MGISFLAHRPLWSSRHGEHLRRRWLCLRCLRWRRERTTAPETRPQKTIVSPTRLQPTSQIAQSKSIKMDMSTTMSEREKLIPIIDLQRSSDART